MRQKTLIKPNRFSFKNFQLLKRLIFYPFPKQLFSGLINFFCITINFKSCLFINVNELLVLEKPNFIFSFLFSFFFNNLKPN